MHMAFKTFSLIHSPLQPPGETTVQIAIKRQLNFSTKWAFFKKCLLKHSPCREFCSLAFPPSPKGNTLPKTSVSKGSGSLLYKDLLLLAFSYQKSHYFYLQC